MPADRPAAAMHFTDEPRTGRPSLRAGMGFTASPGTFLMAFEGDFFVSRSLSLGPLVQLGVSDDPVIVAPTLNFQWMFDLPSGMQRLKPFAQWGLGAAYIHDDRRHHDDDDAGFLMNAGFGVEFCLSDFIAVGSNMLFNFLPDRVLGEHFFFSWQVATVTLRF